MRGELFGDDLEALDERRGGLALLDLDPGIGQGRGGEPADECDAGTAPASSLDSERMIQMPSSVPQSSSRVMTSWATSIRRRVRYPESAVRSAVSARPLRAPWVEMKYSRTVRPSRKLLRIGRSMIRPDGSAIRPRMAPSWPILPLFPRAPEAVIIVTGPVGSSDFIISSDILPVVSCQMPTTCS